MIYLASGSPRRRELLAQIGVSFSLLAAFVDESIAPGEAALAYVCRLAAAKAEAGWLSAQRTRDLPVLAADTAVLVEGRILGKPADLQEALGMLSLLSARTHEVLTAITLRTAFGSESRVSHSLVTFRPIEEAEARAYWNTGEPRDKAGAYGIQGLGAVFVAHLRGSYSAVMGLPLFETSELLMQAGVTPWAGAPDPR